MLIQEDLLLGTAWVDLVLGLGPSPHSGLLLPPFILSFSLLSNVHVYVQIYRADTCPISPYPKWLGWL